MTAIERHARSGRSGRPLRCGVAMLCVLALHRAVLAQTYPVGPELWDRPRSGPIVASDPAVREAASRMIAQSDARLAIRHARSPEAALQAEELRAWLVAYAIDARRIELRADLDVKQAIVLQVTP